MRPIKKILCAVDFLDYSPLVAEYAVAMAQSFDAEIIVVYVAASMPMGDASYEMGPEHLKQMTEEQSEAAREIMREFMEQNLKGARASSRVVTGVPATGIMAQAVENDADIIVMGTLGRKGFRRLLFGSVAEEVVKSAPVPVLTIRPLEE